MLCCLSLGPYPLSTVAAAADRPIRESMTLPVDGQVAKTFFTVDEYLAEQRYEELTDVLLDLAEVHGRELVAVPSEKNSQAVHYLNVALHAQRILAALPPAGLAVCRSRLDPPAKRWYEAWQATREETHLQRILRSAYVSRFGDNALWELGESAWDRGDFSLAAAYWRQLDASDSQAEVPRLTYPDPEFAPFEVAARLILCEIYAQRHAESEVKLASYRERFPDAEGTLAGKSGRWHELLRDVLQEATRWNSEAGQSIATFGGANERQRSWTIELDLGPMRWTKSWPVRLLPQFVPPHPQDRGPLASFPVVDRQLMFVSDGEAIRAWNVLSGEPAWPNAQSDPSLIYPSVPQERPNLPFRPCVGTPWQTLTLAQGKLLARMGSPLTGAADSEHGELVADLVCLDVGRGEGKLLWKLSADDLPAGGRPWAFEGTPVVVEAAAYGVLYRRRPEAEFALVAIDVETGAVQWLKSLGSVRPNIEEGVNRVSHLLLTSGDGRLYLSTDQGTILALSPEDGRPLWAVSYESQPQPLQHGIPAHLQSGLLPPVFSQGLLFVAPNDGRTLNCLEAASGRIVWQRAVPDSSDRFRHLLGVTTSPGQGRLIASGNSLWAINVHDGSLGWRLTHDNRTDGSYGQGLLTGHSVFWPTREWLYQVNQRTGELERKLALHTDAAGHSGGNLAVADGVLIIAEPDRIAVYGEYSLLKKRLELELSQRRDLPGPWRRLMDLEASIQAWDAAVKAGRTAWSLRQSLSPSDAAALRQTYTALLWRLIRRKQELRDFAAAEMLFDELSGCVVSPDERGRFLWERARFDLLREEPALAVARWHELLARHSEFRLEIDGRPAQEAVREELERILRTSGRTPFAAVDRQANEELTSALSAGDVDAVRRILRLYPLLETAAEIWPRLIAEQSRRGHWTSVWPLLEEWRAAASSAVERDAIAQQKAALLRTAGYDRTADRLQNSLAERTPAWHYAVKGWSQRFSKVSRALVPRGSPPADHLACVLAAGSNLALLDRGTGRERWKTPLDSPPAWAGYGEANLVLAEQNQLCGVTLESGDRLWRKSWGTLLGIDQPPHEPMLWLPDRLILFDPQRGLSAVSTITGDLLWEHRPQQGRLQPPGSLLEQGLIVQTVDPQAFHLIDTATGKLLRTDAGAVPAWRFAPVDLGAGKFAVTTTDRQVLAWGPQPTEGWKYAGAISHAHADPWLCVEGDNLALLIDGVTLAGLDRANGERLWTAGLADLPVTDPSRQIAVAQGVIATAWLSQIRAVTLQDGRIAWEQPLPAGITDWRLQTWRGQIAVSGVSASSATPAVLLLFDAISGQPRQMVKHAGDSDAGAWHIDDYGLLWTSPSEIAAWQPLPAVGSAVRTMIDSDR